MVAGYLWIVQPVSGDPEAQPPSLLQLLRFLGEGLGKAKVGGGSTLCPRDLLKGPRVTLLLDREHGWGTTTESALPGLLTLVSKCPWLPPVSRDFPQGLLCTFPGSGSLARGQDKPEAPEREYPQLVPSIAGGRTRPPDGGNLEGVLWGLQPCSGPRLHKHTPQAPLPTALIQLQRNPTGDP